MLTELQLSNFKSWRELDMQLGRVTTQTGSGLVFCLLPGSLDM